MATEAAAARSASLPIQLAALLVGFVDGVLTAFFLLSFLFAQLLRLILPANLDQAPAWATVAGLVVIWLAVAFCAYVLAAPASWRGLFRRAALVLGVNLLLFAALGYMFEFAGGPPSGMPDLGPGWQVVILVVGIASMVGYWLLRGGRRAPVLTVAPAPGAAASADPFLGGAG